MWITVLMAGGDAPPPREIDRLREGLNEARRKLDDSDAVGRKLMEELQLLRERLQRRRQPQPQPQSSRQVVIHEEMDGPP